MKEPDIFTNLDKGGLKLNSTSFVVSSYYLDTSNEISSKTIGVVEKTGVSIKWIWSIDIYKYRISYYAIELRYEYTSKEDLFDYLSKNYKEEFEWLLFNLNELSI